MREQYATRGGCGQEGKRLRPDQGIIQSGLYVEATIHLHIRVYLKVIAKERERKGGRALARG